MNRTDKRTDKIKLLERAFNENDISAITAKPKKPFTVIWFGKDEDEGVKKIDNWGGALQGKNLIYWNYTDIERKALVDELSIEYQKVIKVVMV